MARDVISGLVAHRMAARTATRTATRRTSEPAWRATAKTRGTAARTAARMATRRGERGRRGMRAATTRTPLGKHKEDSRVADAGANGDEEDATADEDGTKAQTLKPQTLNL